jgi:hypothetical protein
MRSQLSRTQAPRTQAPRIQAPRTLPVRPSLRHLKLEAKRRLAAGEFATLHEAQTAIAREHGLSGWARLKQACTCGSHALAHLLWVAERFFGAGRPGWTAPGEDELRQHFDDRFLAAIAPGTLAEQASQTGLRGELVVISQTPLEAQVELAGLRLIAAADAVPPHRLIGLRAPGRRRHRRSRRRGRHRGPRPGTPAGLAGRRLPGPDQGEHRLPRGDAMSSPALAVRALPGVISLEYAVIAVSVLGVLAFSAEYSTGLIRVTFTAAPRRRAVLAAKAVVLAALTLAVGEAVAFASFGLDQAILASRRPGRRRAPYHPPRRVSLRHWPARPRPARSPRRSARPARGSRPARSARSRSRRPAPGTG